MLTPPPEADTVLGPVQGQDPQFAVPIQSLVFLATTETQDVNVRKW